MGEMIQKPDINPIIVALANWIGLGGVGYFLMGQQKKAIISIVVVLIGGFCTCGLLYMFPLLTAFDGYKLAERLQKGEAIGQNENALDFLNFLFKD